MVFEPEAAPREHAAFMPWYFELTKWNDGPYDDPGRSSHRLRAWITEMQRTFPDMNSLEAADFSMTTACFPIPRSDESSAMYPSRGRRLSLRLAKPSG